LAAGLKMENINYQNVVQALLDAIPEIKSKYEEKRKQWAATSKKDDFHTVPTIVYEGVFVPYVKFLFDSGAEAELKKVFIFLERLSSDFNERLKNLVEVPVCEDLDDYLERARQYMGPRTLQLSIEFENHMNEIAKNRGKTKDNNFPKDNK